MTGGHDLYARRVKCTYCPKTYAFTSGRDKHQEAKHWNELVRDFPDVYQNRFPPEPRTSGAPHQPSEAEALANYQVLREKARKWDKLVELLPTIERFLEYATQKLDAEERDVQAHDYYNT